MTRLLDPHLVPDLPHLDWVRNTNDFALYVSVSYSTQIVDIADFYVKDTDFVFQASRRKFTTTLAREGFQVFAYEFTDPDATVTEPIPIAPGSLGGMNFSFN